MARPAKALPARAIAAAETLGVHVVPISRVPTPRPAIRNPPPPPIPSVTSTQPRPINNPAKPPIPPIPVGTPEDSPAALPVGPDPAVTGFRNRLDVLRPLIVMEIPGADFATKTNQALLASVLDAYEGTYADTMAAPTTQKIYGLVALVDRAMELASEIRRSGDTSKIARNLVDSVVRPAILRQVENLSTEITNARNVLLAEMPSKEAAINTVMEKLLRGHGVFISETAKFLEAQIMETALPPPPTVRKRR